MMSRARQNIITPEKVALIERCYRDYVISSYCAQEMSLEKKIESKIENFFSVYLC